jgi:uncharacterized membrane protein YjgN (DUF898 family)
LLIVPIGLATGIAYILRPSLLPAIVAVPALWYLLALQEAHAGRVSRALLLALAVALPFIVHSGLRWKSVGESTSSLSGALRRRAWLGSC